MISCQFLKNTRLFQGIAEEEISAILKCSGAAERTYHKGETLWQEGSQASDIGLVLSGAVHIVKEDYWGNRMILSRVGAGELFGESYACVKAAPLTVTVIAAEDCSALFLPMARLLQSCSSACAFHSRLMQNLLSVLAQKNLMLNSKIDIVTRRSTRDKLMAYLSVQARQHRSPVFTIPFTRQQLADFLAVDRSAMTVELGKLAAEGVLAVDRNRFELL